MAIPLVISGLSSFLLLIENSLGMPVTIDRL